MLRKQNPFSWEGDEERRGEVLQFTSIVFMSLGVHEQTQCQKVVLLANNPTHSSVNSKKTFSTWEEIRRDFHSCLALTTPIPILLIASRFHCGSSGSNWISEQRKCEQPIARREEGGGGKREGRSRSRRQKET